MADQVDHATWILSALERRSPVDVDSMTPASRLTVELALSDLDIRSFSDSLRRRIKQFKKDATLKRDEVVAAANVRGVLVLTVRKAAGIALSEVEADDAIETAKGAWVR